jgi:hypothetical protein
MSDTAVVTTNEVTPGVQRKRLFKAGRTEKDPNSSSLSSSSTSSSTSSQQPRSHENHDPLVRKRKDISVSTTSSDGPNRSVKKARTSVDDSREFPDRTPSSSSSSSSSSGHVTSSSSSSSSSSGQITSPSSSFSFPPSNSSPPSSPSSASHLAQSSSPPSSSSSSSSSRLSSSSGSKHINRKHKKVDRTVDRNEDDQEDFELEEKQKNDDVLAKLSPDADDDDDKYNEEIQPTLNEATRALIASKHEFFMSFRITEHFKKMIDLICPVMSTIDFCIMHKINKSGQTFQGVHINTMDDSTVCMIVARLSADEVVLPLGKKEYSFTVAASQIQAFVKNFPDNNALEFKQMKGADDVQMRSFNQNDNSFETKTTIPTIDMQKQKNIIDTLNYDYTVEISLPMFRTIIKTAQSGNVGAKYVGFEIFEAVDVVQGLKMSKLVISVDTGAGGVRQDNCFNSVTEWKRDTKGQTTIRTSRQINNHTVSHDLLKSVFCQKFPVKYLNLFVTPIWKDVIQLRLSMEKPMVVLYPFSEDQKRGYCNFILAPVVDQETE